jgi:hypothetical protein
MHRCDGWSVRRSRRPLPQRTGRRTDTIIARTVKAPGGTRPQGNDSLPTPQEALREPFAAFPS